MNVEQPEQQVFTRTKLSARLVEAFAIHYLYKNLDEPKPTPEFHRESWELYCQDFQKASVIAPRGHAKSSALTHIFILATALFRVEDYIILVSTNEELAIEHLGDINRELTENEELIEDFKIKGFVTNSKTEIVVEFEDGHQFRVLARGSGQKMRGRKWRGKRPGLIVCDDLEDDEQVENKDRRDKFRKWFNRAVIPALRKGGKVRVHGTILHEDSLLSRFKKQPEWHVKFYRAHKSFDDFSELLWPEQHSEEALSSIRQGYIEDFDAAGYSQEYLNDPFDNVDAYLKKEWFLDMEDEHFEEEMKRCIGVDFAISKKDKANRTSFSVAGQTSDNFLQFIDQEVDRWDTNEIMDMFFTLHERHQPYCFFVEDGIIWKVIEPMLNIEMRMRQVFLSCVAILPVKDKASRGRSWQKRMKAKSCRFNKKASWYPGYEAEVLRFTGNSDAVLDDQFDSSAIVSRGFDDLPILTDEDFMTDEELYARNTDRPDGHGRSKTTGY